MMRLTTPWRMVAAFGAAGLIMAGCGTDATTDVTAEGETDTETTTPTDDMTTPPPEGGGGGGDGTLTIGTLLPVTGSLSFLGPPEFAGVDLAVQEINQAGGVLGKPVKKFDSDSGDTETNIAQQSVNRLLGQDVDVIIGAASSSVSLSVIDTITRAGVVQISPANTSTVFTTYDDNGLYFRTAPSDVLQGRVMGNLILQDANATVAIMALQDAYGEALAANVQKSVEDGGGQVVETVIYDPKTANFAPEVSKIKAADPDAIVVIAFEETKKIIPEMIEQGIGPQDKNVYFVDGNLADYSKESFAAELQGTKGTLPGAEVGDDFRKRLLKVNPKLTEFAYAPESYDAVVLAALAAEAAKSDAGKDIAAELVGVSSGGQKCMDFASCQQMLADGGDIDYDGVSGPVEWSEVGDPTQATIGIYQYQSNGTPKALEYLPGKV